MKGALAPLSSAIFAVSLLSVDTNISDTSLHDFKYFMLSTSKFLPSKLVEKPFMGITPTIFNLSIISWESEIAPSKFSIMSTIFSALSSLHLGLFRGSGKRLCAECNRYGSHFLLLQHPTIYLQCLLFFRQMEIFPILVLRYLHYEEAIFFLSAFI